MSFESVKNLHEVSELGFIAVDSDISLKPLQQSDASCLAEIVNQSPDVRANVGFTSDLKNEQDALDAIEAYRQDKTLVRYGVFDQNNLVGVISAWQDVDDPFGGPDEPDAYGFGYFLTPEARGKGIIGRSLTELMKAIEAELGAKSFIAYVTPNNASSRAVLERLGFVLSSDKVNDEQHGIKHLKYEKILPTTPKDN